MKIQKKVFVTDRQGGLTTTLSRDGGGLGEKTKKRKNWGEKNLMEQLSQRGIS